MVQEFKAQPATYDASVGHVGGGNVNLVRKSGTNQFHGLLSERASTCNSATNF
jgi:hypothetical protein